MSNESAPESAHERLFTIRNPDGSEPDLWNIALAESWAKNLLYCDIDVFAVDEEGILILFDECDRFAYPPEGRFIVEWPHQKRIAELEADNADLRAKITRLARALAGVYDERVQAEWKAAMIFAVGEIR